MTPLLEALSSAAHIRRRDRSLAPLEARVVALLRNRWAAEGAAAARYVLAHAQPSDTMTWLNAIQAPTRPTTANAMRRAAEAAYRAGAAHGARDMGLKAPGPWGVEEANPGAVAAFEYNGAELIAGIDEATRDSIRVIIRQGLNAGWSPQRTAAQIIQRYAQFSAPSPLAHVRNRAELVAITEMGNSYVAGNVAAAKAADIPTMKRWLTAGDERVDDALCLPNAGADWIPMDDTFPSGHEQPLAHPGCRCDLQIRPRG